jgi:hypothetical protein
MRRLSYEWLAGLREIVIDPVRCPLAYEEFRLKEFECDRDGTWVDEIPDGSDHSIDAVRYARHGRRAEGCVGARGPSHKPRAYQLRETLLIRNALLARPLMQCMPTS